jgi:hypothetical protein
LSSYNPAVYQGGGRSGKETISFLQVFPPPKIWLYVGVQQLKGHKSAFKEDGWNTWFFIPANPNNTKN